MSETVGTIEYIASINTADFKKGAKEIDGSAKDVSKNVEDSMGKTESSVRAAGHAVAAGLTVAGTGMTAFAKSATDFTVDYVKDVKKIARETGTTTEETSRLLYVFKRMGVDADSASQSFGMFSKKITESANGTAEHKRETEDLNIKIAKTKQVLATTQAEIVKHGDKTGTLSLKVRDLKNDLAVLNAKLTESAGPFDKLGIKTVDATGKQRAFSEILLDVADKFKTLPDGAEKTALSMELFGRAGKNLLPVLNQGRDGIIELEKQADKLGLTLTATNIDSISKYISSQKDLKDSTDAVKVSVGLLTAPVLGSFNKKLNDTILALTNTQSPFKQAAANVLAFGGPVSVAAGGIVEFASGLGSATESAGGFKGLMAVLGKSFGWITVVAIAAAALFYLEQRFSFFSNILDTLQPKLETLYHWFQDNILPTLVMIGSFVAGQLAGSWQSFKSGVESIMASLAPFHDQLLFAAKILGVILVVAVAATFIPLALLTTAIVTITVVVARLIGWITQLWGAMIQLASITGQTIHSFATTIAVGLETAIAYFRSLPGRIMAEIGNMRDLLYQAGRDLIQGMINGVRNMAGELGNAVRNVAHSAVDAAKSALGIHSPSTVFMSIGKNVTVGLAQGILQAGNIATSAMGNVIDSLPTSISSTAQIDSMGSIDSFGGQPSNVNVSLNMSGIMSRSKTDEREIAKSLVRSINQELAAKNVPILGGGAI